jgi:hypothetical protein
MSDEKDRLEKQSREDRETTRRWEEDRVNPLGQEPENPQRTREWDEDKSPKRSKMAALNFGGAGHHRVSRRG